MALFKILRGNSNNLPKEKKDGYCYFTTDTGLFYIDISDNERLALNANDAQTLLGKTIITDVTKDSVDIPTSGAVWEAIKNLSTSTNTALDTKMNKKNPTGTGYFSLNRKAGSSVGGYSFAEGYNTTASGNGSHAEGTGTEAKNRAAHAEGVSSIASGEGSHAEGVQTHAIGKGSHAEGYSNANIIKTIVHNYAPGQGEVYLYLELNIDDLDKIIGALIKYGNDCALITSWDGGYITVDNESIFKNVPLEGVDVEVIFNGVVSGQYAHGEGYNTTASGDYSHAEGYETKAEGNNSHTEGVSSIANGEGSHAEGSFTKATKNYSHAEGQSSMASGEASHAEGKDTKSQGEAAHAEGYQTTALGAKSHIEGASTLAVSSTTTAKSNEEIINTWNSYKFALAKGDASHVEGKDNLALGTISHAEGYKNIALGNGSHVEGQGTIAKDSYMHVQGQFNKSTEGYAHVVGWGDSDIDRKDIHRLNKSGDAWYAGKLYSNDSVSAMATNITNGVDKDKNDVPGALRATNLPLSLSSVNLYNAEKQYVVNECCYIDTKDENGKEGYSVYKCIKKIDTQGINLDNTEYWEDLGEISSVEFLNKNIPAQGYSPKAEGIGSMAIGYNTKAFGDYSFASGNGSTVWGNAAHAEGYQTKAEGNVSHTEGTYTKAYGNNSHAEGTNSETHGADSHAEGTQTTTMADSAHAEGKYTIAYSEASHAEGRGDILFVKINENSHDSVYQIDKIVDNKYLNGNIVYLENSVRTFATITEISSDIITLSKKINIEAFPLEAIIYTSGAFNNQAHSEGQNTIATGLNSHAEGQSTKSVGQAAHAEGVRAIASGNASHAEGADTIASGNRSHAEGEETIASGKASHTEGYQTETNDAYAHAEGKKSKTSTNAQAAHAEGVGTQANSHGAHSEGRESIAAADSAHAEGKQTKAGYDINNNVVATSYGSHTEGLGSKASKEASHAEGKNTNAHGISAHAEGQETKALADNAHAEGYFAQAIGRSSHAEGGKHSNELNNANNTNYEGTVDYTSTTSLGELSHAEGLNTLAEGEATHTEGTFTLAYGKSAHAEGDSSWAIGIASHSEGESSLADGDYSHAEGMSWAEGEASHAEGSDTHAEGSDSHSEGSSTYAKGISSHSEGCLTQALGKASHAEGDKDDSNNKTIAYTRGSHAEGLGTTAGSNGDNYSYGAHAEGVRTKSSGHGAHAEGFETRVNGKGAHAEGVDSLAEGEAAHAEGYQTKAKVKYSHAEGKGSVTFGAASHAEGSGITSGYFSHAEGEGSKAGLMVQIDDINDINEYTISTTIHYNIGNCLKEIQNDKITILYNIKEYNTANSGYNGWVRLYAYDENNTNLYMSSNYNYSGQHAEGVGTMAIGLGAHSEGKGTRANGLYTHAEGWNTLATANDAHVEGYSSVAYGTGSHVEGGKNEGFNSYTHVEGAHNKVYARQGHAEGYGNIAGTLSAYEHDKAIDEKHEIGDADKPAYSKILASHAEGFNTQSIAQASHSEGIYTKASNTGAHAEGYGIKETYSYTTITIEGVEIPDDGNRYYIQSDNQWVYVKPKTAKLLDVQYYVRSKQPISKEWGTVASSLGSHAEGVRTQSKSYGTHTEGRETIATADSAHAEGYMTKAGIDTNGTVYKYSYGAHAEGVRTQALHHGTHAEGRNTIAALENSHAEGFGSKSEFILEIKAEEVQPISRFQDILEQGKKPSYTQGMIVSFGNENEPDKLTYKYCLINNNSIDAKNCWAKAIFISSAFKDIIEYDYNQVTFEDQITIPNDGNEYFIKNEDTDEYEKVAAGTQINSDLVYWIRVKISQGQATYYTYRIQVHSAHAEGWNTIARNNAAHAEGYGTKSEGLYSHTEGHQTRASSLGSHAEGRYCKAGYDPDAKEEISLSYGAHAEGVQTVALNHGAHAEGRETWASGDGAHAEGYQTIARGKGSHAGGYQSKAYGTSSNAFGVYSVATGDSSFVVGRYNSLDVNDSFKTTLIRRKYKGAYNKKTTYSKSDVVSYNRNLYIFQGLGEGENESTIIETPSDNAPHWKNWAKRDMGQDQSRLGEYAFIVGNGENTSKRSNAFTVSWDGDGVFQGIAKASAVLGAVWNDYAEYRDQTEIIEPGYCVVSADNGQVSKTTEKFQVCDGIVSDTFGFAIGETDNCKTPLAVAGRVLAYCEGDRLDYHAGDTVCAGPNGKVTKMTREEIREWPDRIVGTVSEIPMYETWGTGNVAVNGRIWIKIK